MTGQEPILLPCPFCGEDTATQFGINHTVDCYSCSAQGPRDEHGDHRAAWNRRALPAPPAERAKDKDGRAIVLTPNELEELIHFHERAEVGCLQQDDFNGEQYHRVRADLLRGRRDRRVPSPAPPPSSKDDGLRAEVEKDAARYRWLRENRSVLLVTGFFGDCCMNKTGEMVDDVIDAALAGNEGA